MSSYYSTLIFITISAMIVCIIHFFENQTLSRRVRQQLIFAASLIIIGVMCEFFGICLNSSTLNNTKIIHALIKAIEFTVTPIIPASYINIIGFKNIRKKTRNIMVALLGLNALLELINIIVPFIFYIDENNVYKHGACYIIYIAIYSIEIVIFVVELLKNSKKYQIRNIATLVSILVFLFMGLSIRIIDNSVNSDWLIVAIIYLLFVIYFSDLSLKIDPLTGLLNRKSYQYRLRKLDYITAIIMFDVNDFKQINDQMGHVGGDRALKVVSSAIMECFGKYGYCYRIGGDEFCVILKSGILEKISKNKKDIALSQFVDDLNESFDRVISTNCKDYSTLKHGVSKGYALFFGNSNLSDENTEYLSLIQKTIELADKRLYENKQKK